MHTFQRLLLAAAVAACSLPGLAAPTPQPSALPDVPQGMQCADGKTSKECDIQTMMSERGMPLQSMWTAGRFEQLDSALLSLCRSGTRLPDGQPELLVFEKAFFTLFDAWQDWDGFGAKLDKWRSNFPQSPAQVLVEAMYWRTYAWHARGGGYAGKVPKEAWDLFGERLARAGARLEQGKEQAAACPLWHSLYIENLIDRGAPRAAVDAAYADAVKAFPGSQQVHFAMSRAALPKWGAGQGEFDRFARRAITYARGEEGSAIYARLYWSEDCDCSDALAFGKPGSPDWKLVKSGFEELLQRYPDEIYNRNKFASFACRANDRATYLKLRSELGANIVDRLWPSSWKVEVCDRRMQAHN